MSISNKQAREAKELIADRYLGKWGIHCVLSCVRQRVLVCTHGVIPREGHDEISRLVAPVRVVFKIEDDEDLEWPDVLT